MMFGVSWDGMDGIDSNHETFDMGISRSARIDKMMQKNKKRKVLLWHDPETF